MRIAILSDIHSNLEALEAVLEDVKRRGYDRMVCLGDVVGYGADPERCVEIVREVVSKDENGVESVVRGNHDDASAGGDDSYFNPEARLAVRWTRDHLTKQSFEWLASLPYGIYEEDYYLVHSSPYKPEEWNYVTSMNEAYTAFKNFKERIAFIGHSHVPFHVGLSANGEELFVENDNTIRFKDGYRYISNVGSVGQPRDGDTRACYVILDLSEGTLERVRVNYPVEIAAEKIRQGGLPTFLADRLSLGR